MNAKMRVLKHEESKTTIISISPCAAGGVLKSLHENKLRCDYMGLDQAGRILMEVTFEPHQDKLMKDLNEYMEKCEELLNAIIQSLEEFAKNRYDEIDKMIAEHKKKWKDRKRTSSTILNTQTNGNKQG